MSAKKTILGSTSEGETALSRAAASGYLEVVEALLAARAAIDHQGKSGETALICAIKSQGDDLIKLWGALMRAGSSPNISSKLKLVGGLLAAGAAIDLQDKRGKTALIYAAEQDSLEVVEALVAAWSAINRQDKRGQTALIFAAKNGNLKVVETLLAAGAVVDHQRRYSLTALMVASARGHLEVVEVLRAAGAAIDPLRLWLFKTCRLDLVVSFLDLLFA